MHAACWDNILCDKCFKVWVTWLQLSHQTSSQNKVESKFGEKCAIYEKTVFRYFKATNHKALAQTPKLFAFLSCKETCVSLYNAKIFALYENSQWMTMFYASFFMDILRQKVRWKKKTFFILLLHIPFWINHILFYFVFIIQDKTAT